MMPSSSGTRKPCAHDRTKTDASAARTPSARPRASTGIRVVGSTTSDSSTAETGSSAARSESVLAMEAGEVTELMARRRKEARRAVPDMPSGLSQCRRQRACRGRSTDRRPETRASLPVCHRLSDERRDLGECVHWRPRRRWRNHTIGADDSCKGLAQVSVEARGVSKRRIENRFHAPSQNFAGTKRRFADMFAGNTFQPAAENLPSAH